MEEKVHELLATASGDSASAVKDVRVIKGQELVDLNMQLRFYVFLYFSNMRLFYDVVDECRALLGTAACVLVGGQPTTCAGSMV